ncbi:MAG: peptidase [Pseudomonadota bacterium]
MTYCVALRLDAGIVMLSDTRTNAGIDNVSRYGKMFTWEVPGERAICLMCAGNLSITQGVVTAIDTALRRRGAAADDRDPDAGTETILSADSMYRVAEIVGAHMATMQERYRDQLSAQGQAADASIIVAGQRIGGEHRAFMVYSPGNFIEATPDTPFLQIGEHKYGKPILDRVITPETPIARALKAVYVSMDSTLRSNLSVGMPLDLAVIRCGDCRFALRRRIEEGDAEFTDISERWSNALRDAFGSIPDIAGV